MNVWLITFNNDIEQQRVTNNPTTALDICVEYIKKVYPKTQVPIDWIKKSFLENPNDFGYGLTCWVKRVEVE